MPPKRRVSLRDIAKITGVSAVTVSRALRNSNHVSKDEALRIRKIAVEMGYSVNPYLSSWMRQVRERRQIHDREVLAYITYNLQHENYPWQKNFFSGATRFADQTGYKLELFAVDDYPDLGALFRTLRNRGIRGVIIAVLLDAPLPIEALQHSLVCWHRPRDQEKVDFVDIEYFDGMMLALEKLADYGYRRIAYWSMNVIQQHRRWEAAYLFHQREVPQKNRLPILKVPLQNAAVADFENWVQVHQPDAIIYMNNHVYRVVKTSRHDLLSRCAWISLGTESEQGIAGINQHLDMVGEAAARMVTRKMELNEVGFAAQPRTVIVQPEWLDGPSAKRLSLTAKHARDQKPASR